MKAVVAVAGATATNRDDFAREHVKVALSGCGGSARADVDLARHMTGRLAAAGAALARGEISYSHARVLSTETFDLDDATAGTVAAAVLFPAPDVPTASATDAAHPPPSGSGARCGVRRPAAGRTGSRQRRSAVLILQSLRRPAVGPCGQRRDGTGDGPGVSAGPPLGRPGAASRL